MDIYNLINSAAYITTCNSTEENKYIMALDNTDFWNVYKELKCRDTFLIIDKKGNINFFIKLIDITIIKDLLRSNNIYIRVEWNNYGPEIIIERDGLQRIPGFILQLKNNMDDFILQRFLENNEVFIQYIIQDEKGIIKLLTEKKQMDKNFIERLKYYIELDFYSEYPRILEEERNEEYGYYIKTHEELKVLEEVLDIVSGIKHSNTNEQITVHVEVDGFYKIIFSGDILNIENLMDEICNKINVIEKGRTEVRGKPFLKYKNGLLYFFQKPIKKAN